MRINSVVKQRDKFTFALPTENNMIFEYFNIHTFRYDMAAL